MSEATTSRRPGRLRPRGRNQLVRVLAASLAATAGIVAAPVISTGSADQAIEPTIVEESVTAEEPTVEADFDLAAVVLDEDTDMSEVEVRVRNDEGWGDWTALEVLDTDDGPDPDTDEYARAQKATEPLLAAGSSEIEVRVSEGSTAGVVLIDGGAPGAQPAGRANAAPKVVSRAGWGADESIRNCTPTRLSGYRAAVVHHTVTKNDYTAEEAPSLVRSIYAYHAKTLEWCDIGYQFLVDKYGTIYEGRYGSAAHAVQGAQSAGFNAQTFGVSVLGTFTDVAPPQAAMSAVDAVIQWQLGLDRVDPTGKTTLTSAGNSKFPKGTTVTLPNVMGHRDNGLTACPGDAFYAKLPSFRHPLPADPGPARPIPKDSSTPAPPGGEVDPPPASPTLERIGEANRYETSARVSEHTFRAEAPIAYIASGHDFPDALAGAPAAVERGGPLLLTGPTALPEPVQAELLRLKPTRIVTLGGEGVIDDEIVAELEELTQEPVIRLGGKNRYETAALISAHTYQPKVPVAYITSGHDFADALSGAPAAGIQDGPMLLTSPTEIPAVTVEELQRLKPDRIVVLGGAGAVKDTVMTSLKQLTTGKVTRIGGKNRYETSALISAAAFRPGTSVAYVASGHDFPDALSGGPAAAVHGGPILLTGTGEVPDAIITELKRLKPGRIVVLGGTGAVGAKVVEQLTALRYS